MYRTIVYNFKIRIIIKNELDDQRPIVIRQINISDEKKSNKAITYAECGLGWNKVTYTDPESTLFTEIYSINPINYIKNGTQDDALFIAENKYLKVASSDEKTIDLQV